MKKLFALVLALAISLCALSANAEELFDDKFREDTHLIDQGLVGRLSVTVAGDNVFALYENGEIYSWNSSTKEYSLFATVDAFPDVDIEIPYSQQSDDMKALLNSCVFSLLSDGEHLYGLNLISGAIGEITADGIAWNEVKLDLSIINQCDLAWPHALIRPFFYQNSLIAYYDMSAATGGNDYTPAILQFDLSTGAYTMTSCPKAITMCHYQDDTVLFLQDSGTSLPEFVLYNLSTGEYTNLDITAPFEINRKLLAESCDILGTLGGLTYDAVNDTIYLADETSLWVSTNGNAFSKQEIDDQWEYTVYYGDAWVMPDGTFLFQNGTVYAIDMKD